jgi:hypothetical protein
MSRHRRKRRLKRAARLRKVKWGPSLVDVLFHVQLLHRRMFQPINTVAGEGG